MQAGSRAHRTSATRPPRYQVYGVGTCIYSEARQLSEYACTSGHVRCSITLQLLFLLLLATHCY